MYFDSLRWIVPTIPAIIFLSTLTGGLEALKHKSFYDIRPNISKCLAEKYYLAP
jgi:hypothetical protein